MLSVNQTMGQIKLTEMWKATQTTNNPLQVKAKSVSEEEMTMRSVSNETLICLGSSNIEKNSWVEDAKIIFNLAPNSVKTVTQSIQQRRKSGNIA